MIFREQTVSESILTFKENLLLYENGSTKHNLEEFKFEVQLIQKIKLMCHHNFNSQTSI